MAVLQGESLLNDAVALLVFGLAVTAATRPGSEWSAVPPLLLAVPGGALLGVAVAFFGVYVMRKVAGTLSSIIVQFLLTFGTWILAEHLSLSPILAVVALAAMAARYAPSRTSARDRVNTNAVWAIVVFVLNVLAFLLMGLQARLILSRLPADELRQSLAFAGVVLAVVIGVPLLLGDGLRARAAHLPPILRTPGAPRHRADGGHRRIGILVRHARIGDPGHGLRAAAGVSRPQRDRAQRIYGGARHPGRAGLHDSSP